MSYLFKNLDIIKKKIKEDRDFLLGIIGYEGSGKSNLGIQICKYIDPTFNINRITFTAEEFLMAVNRAKRYEAILMDEGIEAFFTRRSTSSSVVDVTKTLTQIRFKNLFIVLCIPNWFLLESYVRMHRIVGLCKILDRGKVAFFSKDKINSIRRDGITKREFFPKPSFYDLYPKLDDDLWKNYCEKKEKYNEGSRSARVWKNKFKIEEKMKKSYTVRDLSVILSLHKLTIAKYIRLGIIPKKYTFIDIHNQRRITEEGYKRLLKKKLIRKR